MQYFFSNYCFQGGLSEIIGDLICVVKELMLRTCRDHTLVQ